MLLLFAINVVISNRLTYFWLPFKNQKFASER